MLKFDHRTLEEWIDLGRSNGTINNPLTLIGAYCLNTHNALRMIADITTGHVTEQAALRIIALYHLATIHATDAAECDWCEMVRTYHGIAANS